MTEPDLTNLLERLGDRVDVSPPPLAAMNRAADRTRRRRTTWLAAGAAAAVAVVAAGTQVVGDGLGDGQGPASPPPVARPVPDDMRLVGIGGAAIAVPKQWRRNDLACGQAAGDTYIIGVSAIERCLALLYPADLDAVWLFEGRGTFRGGEDIEIDGVPAKRTPTTCSPGRNKRAIVTCRAAVYVPSAGARFQASSSTSRERVDEILDEVRILGGDKVAVPTIDPPDGPASADAYARRLREAGLTVVMKWQSHPGPAGGILGVQPAPGTVVGSGTEVVVILPRPAADRHEVLGLAAYRPDGTRRAELTDAQIRSGATVRLRVGDWISFHARGQAVYGADVAGSSLNVEHLPADNPYPRRATAVRAGTTTFTLTFTVGGEEVQVGSITVVVG